MIEVAFVTWRGLPDLTADDRLAVAALARRGVGVEAVCWDEGGVEWSRYGAVVLRSTWDYHLRLGEFLEWIDRLERSRVRLFNPARILRWNVEKSYLQSLTASASLQPPSTVIVPRQTDQTLADVLEALPWDRAVVKPTVSADGHSTELVSRETLPASQAIFASMLQRGDVMVQAWVPEVQTAGELSLMFFNGQFAHAVRKTPKTGDFRVQERLGGSIRAAAPDPVLIDAARALLDDVAPDHLYARVDIVPAAERPVLMEIELVEPSLFLAYDSASADAFADAIIERATSCLSSARRSTARPD